MQNYPEKEQKVTEKYMRRVLAVSICGILLCMSCLVATTWAWFVVGVENTENIIQIATEPPSVSVKENDVAISNDVPNLSAGVHTLEVIHSGNVDDLAQRSRLYVTFSVNEVVKGYVTLNRDNGYKTTIQITTDSECFVSWTVSWFEPDGADALQGNAIDLSAETDADTEETEETTQPAQQETTPVEDATEPAETDVETTVPVENQQIEDVTQPDEETGETDDEV